MTDDSIREEPDRKHGGREMHQGSPAGLDLGMLQLWGMLCNHSATKALFLLLINLLMIKCNSAKSTDYNKRLNKQKQTKTLQPFWKP